MSKQLEEYLSDWKKRVSGGKLYFIENKQWQKVPFIPNDSQQYLYENLHNYNVIPKARQRGFSTAIEILWLDHCLFNHNVSMWVIAHNLEDAKKIFKTKVKFPYDNLGGFDTDSPEYAVGQEIKRNITTVKDNESTLEFSNWSSIYVSTSFRSGTLQFLHISEFWKICAKYPEKAKEIMSWALEAVWEWGLIFMESTAEWKNEFYIIVKYAKRLKLICKDLNHLEPKLFFFPWWEASEYSLEDEQIILTGETVNYFKMLKKEHWIIVTTNQAKWWQVKKERLKELMGREYPSYLEEAFEIIVMWSYFKEQLETLQKEQRYKFAPYDSRYPVYFGWDLWILDAMDTILFQMIGNEIRIIKWFRGNNMSFVDLHNAVLSKLPYAIKLMFLPHDAVKRNHNDGMNVKKTAEWLWYRVKVLPATWVIGSINWMRTIFNRLVINSQDCTQPIKIWGEFVNLTLVDMLWAYKEEFDKVHWISLGRPEHNDASHTWDNIRYLGQAVKFLENQKNESLQEVYSIENNDFLN